MRQIRLIFADFFYQNPQTVKNGRNLLTSWLTVLYWTKWATTLWRNHQVVGQP
jgi:hypothetical protein